ncbi:MAG: PAS domain-containing sensor histidine kinase, partial [Burkholderiaceae bacterium]|nr:PAS domain-containing sensor histidine kinase [Burkholderiaceae bacterium]
MTRTFRYVLIAGGAMMGVLLFLLASAAENTTFFEQHYPGLLAINLLAAAALLILVALMLRRLYRHHRRKRFGTRLMTRLVLLFSLMGVLPGTVIYIVSVQFVSRSIESWFDVHVETALDAGVKLGRDILENALSDLHAQAEQLSAELSMRPPAERLLILSRLQNTSKKLEASILTRNGRIIAASGLSGQHLLPSMPTPAMLRQAIETSRYLATEWRDDDPETPHANETTLKLRVIVPLSENSLTARKGEPLFLHLLQTVSPTLARDAEALRAAYSEYQVRSVSRSGLQKIYIVTLT